MSVFRGQQQTFLRLLGSLRPHLRDVTLPARLQAAIARHKEFGSRDRRLYRELIYTAVRYLPWIEPLLDADEERAVQVIAWLAAETRDTAAFRKALGADLPAAQALVERAAVLKKDPADLLPSWLHAECPDAFHPEQIETLLSRAPLWIRIQTATPEPVSHEFEQLGWRWTRSAVLPDAWRVLDEVDLTKTASFAKGSFEVQDLGSQLLLETIGVAPGGRWLDACAGAGGKTLQLARLLGASGTVDAEDVRASALDELFTRATRARRDVGRGLRLPPSNLTIIGGIPNSATIRVARSGSPSAAGAALYDGVLIDAPCSGSGTWRRSPHLKWATTPAILASKAALQEQLLNIHCTRVRSGGRLVYATCSLAHTENAAVVSRFLATHPDFEAAPFVNTFGFEPQGAGLTLLPARHDTDGFFVASLRRR